ncbi:MAG: hypothetical protein O7149_06540, partial [Wolbachia endosymbiont of Hylaeus sinuatus]|nr:hypothetical protein [Wolbachia endosymbiont of Hylaeus sinuatus]
FRKILVALHKSLILVLTTSILLSVNSCLSDQILSFTAYFIYSEYSIESIEQVSENDPLSRAYS